MDIIRIWYIIKHRANPSTTKNLCFFTTNPEKQLFSKTFLEGGLAPCKRHPNPSKSNLAPPSLKKVLVAPLSAAFSVKSETDE